MATSRPINHARLFGALLLFSPAAFLVGCGERLDKNPLFKDQMRITERLEEDAKATTWQLEELTVEIKNVKQQVAALGRGGPQAIPAQLKLLEDRVAAIEAGLAESKIQIAVLAGGGAQKRVVKRDAEKNQSEGERAAEASAAEVPQMPKSQEVAAAELKPKTQSARARVSPTPQTAAERPVPRGFYHHVRNGETFELIAERNRIPVDSLLAANRIPPGRNLLPGQQIYVPAVN